MVTENELKCIETHEQKYKRRKFADMYVSREVIMSMAFRKLSGTALRVYLFFLSKRVMKPLQGKQKRSGKGQYYIENDGRIQFTYREAQGRYGISSKGFRMAIERLVEVGLIDIVRAGSGLHRDATQYGLSARWKLYGTDEFIAKKKPKRKQQYGFAKGCVHAG